MEKMSREPLDTIVKKRLKRYKTDVVLLWLIIVMGAVLIVGGIGIYFYVGKLIITQYISTISIKNFITNQVKMLCDFTKALGLVFSLVGVVSIIVALDRLALKKDSYRMASFIKNATEREN